MFKTSQARPCARILLAASASSSSPLTFLACQAESLA